MNIDLQRIFGPDGALAAAQPNFRARPQQVELASAIAEAIADNTQLVAEAGTGTGKSPKVNIGEIIVTNTHLSFNNSDADSIKLGFDYNHFKVKLDNIESQNFQVIGDTIQFQVNSFQATEVVSKLTITDFRTYFRICQTSMDFMLRGSVVHKAICGACAETCERCAESCESIGDDAQLKACAKTCRACAQSCRNMAKG